MIPETSGGDTVLDPPRETGECYDPGNLTRLCTERCQSDGLTCEIQVDIDACTCGGRHLLLHEVTRYDMRT